MSSCIESMSRQEGNRKSFLKYHGIILLIVTELNNMWDMYTMSCLCYAYLLIIYSYNIININNINNLIIIWR